MIRGFFAIIIAAVGAAVLVGFVPPPAPAVAAVQSAARDVTSLIEPAAAPVSNVRSATCTQAWPYYEASCLRDSRSQNGGARIVRVIAAGGPMVDRTRQVQR